MGTHVPRGARGPPPTPWRERVIYVDHTIGYGRQLLEAVRQVGAEGIVSKRLGSLYRGRATRD